MGAAGLALMVPLAPSPRTDPVSRPALAAVPATGPAATLTAAELTAAVQRYCVVCHNDQLLTGNLSLQTFDVAQVAGRAEPTEKAEKMIRKLRAEMMPPPGAPRPGGDTLTQLVETLEKSIDAAFRENPNPGYRTFQRLNRAEYEAAIEDLLGLEINAADWLPVDARSANFDNIADAQTL